jgi:hypothetical protein
LAGMQSTTRAGRLGTASPNGVRNFPTKVNREKVKASAVFVLSDCCQTCPDEDCCGADSAMEEAGHASGASRSSRVVLI